MQKYLSKSLPDNIILCFGFIKYVNNYRSAQKKNRFSLISVFRYYMYN